MPMNLETEEDLHVALTLAPEVGSGRFGSIVAEIRKHGLGPADVAGLDLPGLRALGFPDRAAGEWGKDDSGLSESWAKYCGLTRGKEVRLVSTSSVLYPEKLTSFFENPPTFFYAYGNLRLLQSSSFTVLCSRSPSPADLEAIERLAEQGVLDGKTLVGGTNTDAYQRAAVVPLRWGAPRILVLDRGLFCALGETLEEEPFRTARLWRYRFDPVSDLVVTRQRPFDEYAPANQSKRDELIAALSDEVHAVAIRKGGGMERLLTRAETAGRQVVRH